MSLRAGEGTLTRKKISFKIFLNSFFIVIIIINHKFSFTVIQVVRPPFFTK